MKKKSKGKKVRAGQTAPKGTSGGIAKKVKKTGMRGYR